MAKKRSSGGSNMGIIITLVFFVLATVILGVTTYFGFAEQGNLEAAKKAAEAKEKERELDRNWQRFQVRVLRQYLAKPPAGLDAKDLAREKALFDKGQLTYAGKDKEEVTKLIKDLDAVMPWDAIKTDAPTITYETRLADKDARYIAMVKENDKLKGEKAEAERLAKETGDAKKAADDAYKANLAKLDGRVGDDKKKDREDIDKAEKVAQDASKDKEKSDKAKALAEAALKKSETVVKALETKLATLTRDNKEVRDTLEETRIRLAAVAEKAGVDLRAAEAEALDAKATQVLKAWTKNWSIVQMDRLGKMPYINLGQADGLQPQVSFSIHSVGLDGRLNASAKGTLEVVKVIGPHLAQARITSTKDSKADPIIKGDRLFNATWDPNKKRRIALAGIPDLAGDGSDGTEDFRRLLRRQNVDLDAYIDTKDDKAPKLVGKGITTNTDYLVLAEGLEGVNHPQAKNAAYKAAFDRLSTDLRTKASTSGVTLISLRKYLDLIGYRSPKVVSSGPGKGYGR